MDKDFFSCLCEVELMLMSICFIVRMNEYDYFGILCPLALVCYLFSAYAILALREANEALVE